MEKIMIFGIAAMFGFFSYTSDKPWVVTPPGKAEVSPCVEKPWVVTPPGKAEVSPCIEKPWVTVTPGKEIIQPNIY